MDKDTYEALNRVIDRLRASADIECDDIERVAGWIEEVAKEYAG